MTIRDLVAKFERFMLYSFIFLPFLFSRPSPLIPKPGGLSKLSPDSRSARHSYYSFTLLLILVVVLLFLLAPELVEPIGRVVELGRRGLEELHGMVRAALCVGRLLLGERGLGLRALGGGLGLRGSRLGPLRAFLGRRPASARHQGRER